MLVAPPDLTCTDLALELDDAGGLHYLPDAMERLCAANGIDSTTALSVDDVACDLIARWYVQHREEGGERDQTMEAVLANLSCGGIRNDR